MAKGDTLYRLVVFEEVDDPQAVRDLFRQVTGTHPTDAMQWIAKAPGVWPKPLPEDQVRTLLDGLYEIGVAAEAWRTDQFPDLVPPRTIHDLACLPEGLRVQGLRGEPTHWVPWDRVELLSAGLIEAEDEFRGVTPPHWTSALTMGLRALTLRTTKLPERARRATRVPRDPVGEIHIVRRNPRVAFRVLENQMNYGYLGPRLKSAASENFPLLLADLCTHAKDAYITHPTRALLETRERDAGDLHFPSSQALLNYSTHRLLWSWYRRDRDSQNPTES